MNNKILPVLIAFAALFAVSQAKAYYNPSTGRWLSRDPMGEPGFEVLRAANTVPLVGQVVSTASLPPSRLLARDPIAAKKEPNRYAFVANNPVLFIDVLGLVKEGDPCCCFYFQGTPKFSADTSASTAGRYTVTFTATNIRNVGSGGYAGPGGGCVAEVKPQWETCWQDGQFVDGAVLGPGEYNPYIQPISSGPYTILSTFRVQYLSCEAGRWQMKHDDIQGPGCFWVFTTEYWPRLGGHWECGH